jgi:hypothetical protein
MRIMSICSYAMRTTLNLNDDLIARVRRVAGRTGKTLTEVIEEALREHLSGARTEDQAFELEWVTVSGKLQAGVDLDDRDALLELMEGRP